MGIRDKRWLDKPEKSFEKHIKVRVKEQVRRKISEIRNKSCALVLLFHLTALISCREPRNNNNVDIAQLLRTLRLTYSFTNSLILTSYVFIKIYESLHICTRNIKEEIMEIDCIFDLRQQSKVRVWGMCEKESGKILQMRLKNCKIKLKGEDIYAEINGVAEIHNFSSYQEDIDVHIFRKELYFSQIKIKTTLSEIFLIESEYIRNFRVENGNGIIDKNTVYISKYVVRDDGSSPLALMFEEATLKTSGCVKQMIKMTTDGFLSFSSNACPYNGVIEIDSERITISGGLIYYENKVFECPPSPECTVISLL